ncbi:recombinase family protein [Roseomonas sp. F4]
MAGSRRARPRLPPRRRGHRRTAAGPRSPRDRPVTTHGYVRTSTHDQNPTLQLDALRAAGVDQVLEEVGSGARAERIARADAARRAENRAAPRTGPRLSDRGFQVTGTGCLRGSCARAPP